MTAISYLKEATTLFEKHPYQVPFNGKPFTEGAQWMHSWLAYFNKKRTREFEAKRRYIWYGLLKYAISLAAFFLSLFFLKNYGLLSLPPSIFLFYFVEVHFLFLFPLLLDKAKSPILKSIKTTYRQGIFKTTFHVMIIGIYMLSGLFFLKKPLKRWHIGCLAVLLWYQKEVR